MKTYKDCIEKAIQIADENERSIVGLLIDPQDFANYDITTQSGIYDYRARRYLSKSGGQVIVININSNVYDSAGYQFSHVVVCGKIPFESCHYLRSRLCTPHTFKEQIGIYYMSGVVERLDWWV